MKSGDADRNAADVHAELHAHLVAALDAHFTAWWAAFLLSVLETLKGFRAFGDDDGQLVALALSAASFRRTDPSLSPVPDQGRKQGLSLSAIAIQTGCPLETIRRTLSRMVDGSVLQRDGNLYSIAVPDDLVTMGARQAGRMVRIISGIPGAAPAREANNGIGEATGDDLGATWLAALRYCANLRRRITKGSYLSCLVAGMLQVEEQVRLVLLANGKTVASRAEFNGAAIAMPQPLIAIQQTSVLAAESMTRTRAAVRHAVELGLGSIPERGLFRYSIGAAAVPDDSQAYTRGVKEALADLKVYSSPASKAGASIEPVGAFEPGTRH